MRPRLTLQAAIRLVMVLVFVIMVLQVTAASLRPPISTRLYGSRIVSAGHQALFRVLCVHSDGLSPCGQSVVDAHWVTVAADKTIRPWGPSVAADAFGAVRLAVPAVLPDAMALWIQISDGARQPVDRIIVPVTAQREPATVAGRLRTPIALRAEHKGSVQARLWPQDGAPIAGLVARGAGELVQNDQALSDTFGPQTDAAALVPDGPTDEAGHFSWHAAPQLKQRPWQLQLERAHLQLVGQVELERHQLSLRLVDGPFVAQGQTLRVEVRTLPFRGPVHVDVWLGQALIAGQDVGPGICQISLPPQVEGPLMVTGYRQSLAPDDTHVTQLGWMHAGLMPSAAERQALGRQLGVVDGSSTLWDIAARQGMFVPETLGAPLLEDTHAARQAAFSQAQARRRALGQSALMTTLSFGSFCALAYVRHFVLRRRHALAVAAPGDANGTAAAKAMTHVGLAPWLWPAIGILMLMGAGIWELMGHLVPLLP